MAISSGNLALKMIVLAQICVLLSGHADGKQKKKVLKGSMNAKMQCLGEMLNDYVDVLLEDLFFNWIHCNILEQVNR